MASAPGSTISRGAAIRPGPLPSTPTVNSRYRHHSSTSKPGCSMTDFSDSSLSQRITPALSAPTAGLTTTGRPRFSTMFLAETPGPLTIQAGVGSPREEITRFMNSLSCARTLEDPPPTIAIPLAASGSTKGSEKLIRLLLGKTIVRSVPGRHSGKSAGDSMISTRAITSSSASAFCTASMAASSPQPSKGSISRERRMTISNVSVLSTPAGDRGHAAWRCWMWNGHRVIIMVCDNP